MVKSFGYYMAVMACVLALPGFAVSGTLSPSKQKAQKEAAEKAEAAEAAELNKLTPAAGGNADYQHPMLQNKQSTKQ